MTLFYDEERDAIIENHPDFAEFDDEGRLVLEMGEVSHDEKRRSLLNAAASALEASEVYRLAQEPEIEWVPKEGR